MIHLTVNRLYVNIIDRSRLIALSQNALELLEQNDTDVSIILESDPFITRLNQEYRGINSPTDVLSFEMGYNDPESGRKYLGDIVISMDSAIRQAAARKIEIADEVTLLLVHGLLHLLGFDHVETQERKEMWRIQKEILVALDVSPEALPEK